MSDTSADSLSVDVAWPLSSLDIEPEQVSCIPHGNELPCPICNKKYLTSKEVSS